VKVAVQVHGEVGNVVDEFAAVQVVAPNEPAAVEVKDTALLIGQGLEVVHPGGTPLPVHASVPVTVNADKAPYTWLLGDAAVGEVMVMVGACLFTVTESAVVEATGV